MERDLRVRLSCARVALEGLSGDTRVGVSATQSRVISDLVSRDPSLHSVSLESLAALQELATRVAWEASDKERVLKCLTPKRVLPKDTDSGVARRPMQHFAPAILSYFTNTEWLHLRHGAGIDSKVDLVMQRVSQLTGFNLTENTLKLLASFALYVSSEFAIHTDMMEKRTNLERFKNLWRSHKRRVAKGLSAESLYLVILPSVPAHLKRDQPELWAATFVDEQPVPCQIKLAELIALNDSYGCRGRLSDYSLGSASAPKAVAPQPCGFDAILRQMALQQEAVAQQLAGLPAQRRALGFPANQFAMGLPTQQLAAGSLTQQLALGATKQQFERSVSTEDFAVPPIVANVRGAPRATAALGKLLTPQRASAPLELLAPSPDVGVQSVPTSPSEAQSPIAAIGDFSEPFHSQSLTPVLEGAREEEDAMSEDAFAEEALVSVGEVAAADDGVAAGVDKASVIVDEAALAPVSADQAALVPVDVGAKTTAEQLVTELASMKKQRDCKKASAKKACPKKAIDKAKSDVKKRPASCLDVDKHKIGYSHEGSRNQFLVRTGNRARGQGSIAFKYDPDSAEERANAKRLAEEKVAELKAAVVE